MLVVQKKMTEGFGPKIGGFDHFKFGDHQKLKRLINKNTAAIMVETIMGEGGIKTIPDWCLKGLRKLCDKKKILLILMKFSVELEELEISSLLKNQKLNLILYLSLKVLEVVFQLEQF